MNMEKFSGLDCPIEVAVAVIGGKYKVCILYELMEQTLRYSELQRRLPRATPRMLSKQLKELEEDGVISRMQYPVIPPKTEYSLTPLGRELIPVIRALSRWGMRYFEYLGRPVALEDRENS